VALSQQVREPANVYFIIANLGCFKVLNSDDYWVYERLKRYATRMEVIPVTDLPKDKAMAALKKYRQQFHNEMLPSAVLEQVYNKVGGRLSFLNRVAKSQDVMKTCDEICQAEKTWFLNKCWILGKEMDDDVMDEQKYSVSIYFGYALLFFHATQTNITHTAVCRYGSG
jgi:hypothetical protein